MPLSLWRPPLNRDPAAFSLSERLNMSNSKLYVGNLPYSVDDHTLQNNFAEFGTVASAKVMTDRDSGRSKGFGFVEMGTAEEAEAAIRGMNGLSVGGRSIVVNISRPKESTGGGFGGGYRGERRSSY
jgi:RNA recognition motif-containing protein